MAMQFTVLASGSAGNASLLEADGFGVLLDMGLGPRQLATRLDHVNASSWHDIHAVVLTHTHGDHWKERTFAHVHRRGIPVYCHPIHGDFLRESPAFRQLLADGLVRYYEPNVEWEFSSGLRCRPLALAHDCPGTCGFRFDGRPDFFGQTYSLAYAADLGCWHADLVRAMCDVDALALEFNHDVELERSSGRSPLLIARVLGNHGHLSNDQAIALVREVLRQSEPGRLRHLVQLHLSRDCNRPALARAVAQEVFPELKIHTARQDRPGPRLRLGENGNSVGQRSRRTSVKMAGQILHHQPLLPGWDE